ncbi:MAG: alkaline phosphatase family protein [Pirellula sp.]
MKLLLSILALGIAYSVPFLVVPNVMSQDTSERLPVQLPGLQRTGETLLPNGWSLRPVGEQIDLGDFPCHMETSPDGKYAAILHAGWGTHEVRIVSIAERKQTSSVIVDQTFQGLRFSHDGSRLYVSGAEDECVYVYDHRNGYLTLREKLQLASVKDKNVIAGITETNNGAMLLACGLMMNQLLVADLSTRTIAPDASGINVPVTRIELPKGSFPIDVVVAPDKKHAMVSLWGKASIAVVDLEAKRMTAEWSVRSHPTEMLFLDEGKRLLVGCSDDNSVVMLNTETGVAEEVIRTSLYATSKNGSTPNSLAVTPDGKVLFVANADNNNIAAFDIQKRGQSKSLGFIPVGWYPTSVRMSQTGDQILVTNGKGLASRDNAKGPNPLREPRANVREYIGGLFKGTLSVIPAPSPNMMIKWTKDAYAVSPLRKDEQPNMQTLASDSSIPAKVGEDSPIKHCFYIIKENRTYDQVFGDLPKGNGDKNLCIFPEKVTPNHHALANEFVLLDNFYVESEVSADGHEWSMAAYATDFVERAWPLGYRGGKGKIGYTSEGGYEIAYPSSGYIWDQCKKSSVSYFSFGEFIQNPKTPGEAGKARVPALEGHFDPLYRSYDLDYMDIDRIQRFRERFAEFDKNDDLPQFIVLRIGNDHTSGTKVGKKTPTAMVADNDLALGQLVETISKSRYWNKSAIFVVEDDAQNGSDHVDAHRTVALAISPYIRKGTIDSTLYTTSSMLRSMELILGMPPMTQFDAAANPMYASFGKVADLKPYTARPAQVDVFATNTALAWGAMESEKLDLSREDAADDLLLGEIVWRSVRGPDSKMPPPVRAAFVFSKTDEEEDEEDDNENNGDDQVENRKHTNIKKNGVELPGRVDSKQD